MSSGRYQRVKQPEMYLPANIARIAHHRKKGNTQTGLQVSPSQKGLLTTGVENAKKKGGRESGKEGVRLGRESPEQSTSRWEWSLEMNTSGCNEATGSRSTSSLLRLDVYSRFHVRAKNLTGAGRELE